MFDNILETVKNIFTGRKKEIPGASTKIETNQVAPAEKPGPVVEASHQHEQEQAELKALWEAAEKSGTTRIFGQKGTATEVALVRYPFIHDKQKSGAIYKEAIYLARTPAGEFISMPLETHMQQEGQDMRELGNAGMTRVVEEIFAGKRQNAPTPDDSQKTWLGLQKDKRGNPILVVDSISTPTGLTDLSLDYQSAPPELVKQVLEANRQKAEEVAAQQIREELQKE